MRNKLLLSFLTLSLLFLSSNPVQGSFPSTTTSGNQTSDQFYNVVFDGEGEAAVVAKLTVPNRSASSRSVINLEIPGENLRLINSLQEVSGRNCSNYDYSISSSPICTSYNNSYLSPNYYTLQPSIQKTNDSNKLTVILGRPIEPQGSTTVILNYKVTGYVKNALGIYNFGFETIKSNYDVDNIRVAISVQEGFSIKGGGARTNYTNNFPAASQTAYSGSTDIGLAEFSSRIPEQSGYVKTTQSLDPGENFRVNGVYSSSFWLLYLQDAIKIIIVGALLLLLIISLYKWKGKNLKITLSTHHPIFQVVVTSAAASITLIVTTFGTLWFLERQSSYYLGTLSTFLVILILLILLVISISLIFGPAVYFGIKRGIKYGLFSIVSSIILLILFTSILVIFLSNQYQLFTII